MLIFLDEVHDIEPFVGDIPILKTNSMVGLTNGDIEFLESLYKY